jgi:hypothetical protein
MKISCFLIPAIEKQAIEKQPFFNNIKKMKYLKDNNKIISKYNYKYDENNNIKTIAFRNKLINKIKINIKTK